MLIQSKLRLSKIMVALAAMALLYVSFHSANELRLSLNSVQLMDETISGLFDLSVLAVDLGPENVARAKSDWNAICTVIDDSIANIRGQDKVPAHINNIKGMRPEQDMLSDAYFHIISNGGEESERRRLLAQLQNQIHNMSAESFVVGDLLHGQMLKRLNIFVWVVMGGACFVIFAGILEYYLLKVAILTPLKQLQQDTSLVSEGNLKHKASINSRDEIGGLAEAFNTMTARLASTLVSKQDLEISEERFRRFFEAGLVGNAVTSPQKDWILVNKRLCESLGYTQEELSDMTWTELTHPNDRQKDNDLFGRLLAGEIEGYELDKRFVRKSGEVMHAKQVVCSTWRKDGVVDHCVVMIEDITERVMAKNALSSALKNVKRSNEELEQFAYVASHDLQEPLRMVASYTQLLERRYGNAFDEDGKEFLGYVVDGAMRMQNLINDLLAYSRINRLGKEVQMVDVHYVLGQVRTNLSTLITEKNAVVTNIELPKVQANEMQLIQLFQNLIQNAIKFVPDDRSPLVNVSAEQRNDAWVFKVTDNGIGIEPQYEDRVFQIFQRLHTRSEYEGTGIGLAVCKRIVECQDGQIWFESEPDKGTTFFFTLPHDDTNGDTT